MTAFSRHAVIQQETYSERVKALQDAVQENRRNLEELQQKRLEVEEETNRCTRETEQRKELMMDESGVADALQQLGCLLLERTHLSEQLNGQTSADRNESTRLQERSERATNKASSLVTEILKVKQRLEEVKRNTAARALVPMPTSRSRNVSR